MKRFIYYFLFVIAGLIVFQNCSNFRSEPSRNNSPVNTTNLPSEELPPGEACPLPLYCAPPPENCYYEADEKSDDNQCPNVCGVLKCKAPPVCPDRFYECEPPKPGCRYDEKPTFDENGCPLGCGTQVCDEPPICKALPCAAPPEGCHYENIEVDKHGCQLGCGQLVCDIIVPPPAEDK